MKGLRLLGKLLDPGKPDLKNITTVELDALAEEVTHNYVHKWMNLRIAGIKAEKKELTSDELYVAFMKYITDLSGTFNVARMWTNEGIREVIWGPLMNNQDLWNVVSRGYSEFSSKVYVNTTESSNVSRSALISQVADGLSGFNNKDASDTSIEMVPKEMREVLPQYDGLVKVMTYNPWLLFVYYLSRIDLYEIIYGDRNE